MGTMREDYLPGCGYKIYQDPEEFTFTTDSIFLARFAHLAGKASVLELGCGTGAVSLCLAARGAAKVTGLDLNPRMTELMNRSAEANGLPQVQALTWDIKEIKTFCPTESFDLVAANPPYRNSGRERSVGTAACHEKTAVLEDFFAAAAYALRSRGRFALVQLPERFMEAMELAAKYHLQPKRLQWVHASVDEPAWIFLLEMTKHRVGSVASVDHVYCGRRLNNAGRPSVSPGAEYGAGNGVRKCVVKARRQAAGTRCCRRVRDARSGRTYREEKECPASCIW